MARPTFFLGAMAGDGVTFQPRSGWTADGHVVRSAELSPADDSVSFAGDVIPNSAITPAGTVYRVATYSGDLFAIIPDSAIELDLYDCLTVAPPQPDFVPLPAASLSMVDNGDGTLTLTSVGVTALSSDGHGLVTIDIGG